MQAAYEKQLQDQAMAMTRLQDALRDVEERTRQQRDALSHAQTVAAEDDRVSACMHACMHVCVCVCLFYVCVWCLP